MKARDLALVGAILVVAGVAVADAVRRDGPSPPALPTLVSTVSSRQQTEPTRAVPAPPSFPRRQLRGSVVLTDADDCRVRELLLGPAFERPLPRFRGTCNLWAPPAGSVIAYGLGNPDVGSDTVPFRFVDLDRPDRALGGFRALFGFITWSADGRRAAWCGESRAGVDLTLGGRAQRLPDCPNGYTPGGLVAFARGDAVRVGGRVVLRTEGQITNLHYGRDGSLAVVLEGKRLVRRSAAGRVTGAVELPPALEGRLPLFSPDNCAAVLRTGERLHLRDLGCFAGSAPRRLFGRAAAWSPDGRWLAVAERATVAFYPVVAGGQPLRWPVAAAQLAWQP